MFQPPFDDVSVLFQIAVRDQRNRQLEEELESAQHRYSDVYEEVQRVPFLGRPYASSRAWLVTV